MMGDLAVAYVFPVEPYVKAGIHAFKIQKGAGCFRILMPEKSVQIGTAGIVLGNIGRIKRKRISNVGILGTVIPPQLPAEGYCLLFPPFSFLIVRQIKQVLQIMDAGIKSKAPFASAEHLQTVRTFPVPYHHVIAGRGRNIICPVRLRILMEDQGIFIKPFYDQKFCLLSFFSFVYVFLPLPLMKAYRKISMNHMNETVQNLHKAFCIRKSMEKFKKKYIE